MKGLVFTLIVIVSFLSANAQESTKKSSKSYKEEKQAEQIKKVSELVENKTFVFNAHKAVPLCGDAVNLEYLFFVNLNNNKITSYLPFYGFESDYTIENTPLSFTSTINDYSINLEKDKFVITFNVSNNDDDLKFYFRISKLGYTYLKITSEQRQPISFLGIIDESEPSVSVGF